MSLVPSLLQAIVQVDGEALVMHAGDTPYVVTPDGQVDLASRGLALDAVNGIVSQLLPAEVLRALDEFGAAQYQLPPRPDFPNEQFTVVAARGGDDLWAEIRRHRVPDEDQVPEEVFAPAATAVAGSQAGAMDGEALEVESAQASHADLLGDLSDAYDSAASGARVRVGSVVDASVEMTLDDEELTIPDAPVLWSETPAIEAVAAAPEIEEPVQHDEIHHDEISIDLDGPELAEDGHAPESYHLSVETEPSIQALHESAPVEMEEPSAIAAQEEAPPIVMEEETPAIVAQEEAPPIVMEEETPAIVAQEEAPPIVMEEETPAIVALEEAPPIVMEEETSAIAAQEEAPPIVMEEEAPAIVAQEEAPPIVMEEETPAIVAQEEAPPIVMEEETPAIVAQEEAPPIVMEEETPAIVAQEEAPPIVVEEETPVITAQEEAPAIIVMEETSVIVTQEEAPPIAAEEETPLIAAQEVTPIAVEEEAPPIVLQGEAPPAPPPVAAVAPPTAPSAPPPVLQREPTAARPRQEAPAPRRETPAPRREAPPAPRAVDPPAAVRSAPPVERPQMPPAAAGRDVPAPPRVERVAPRVEPAPAPVVREAAAASVEPRPAPPAPHLVQAEPSQPAVVLPMLRNPIRPEAQPTVTGQAGSGLDRLLRLAAARGASTLYLATGARPSVRVDGENQALDGEPTLSSYDVESLLLTLMPERSHEALRTGAASEWICDIEEVGRVRCMSFRDHRGPGGIFRLMAGRAVSMDQLALSREIQSLAIEPEGLVLIVGPRSSGKRTLISAFIDLINRTRRDHVISIESEINVVHDRGTSFISQREVRGSNDDLLAAARGALREDPDVLVIEDLPTGALMNVALEAAALGHLVIGGFSAHSATGAIDRIIDLYAPEYRHQIQMALAQQVRGVVAQVLLRRNGGGRVAARELLLNTPAMASVIAEGKTSQLPMAIEGGRRHGMVPLNDALVGFVQSGIVDAGEAYRRAADRSEFLSLLKRQGIDTTGIERLA